MFLIGAAAVGFLGGRLTRGFADEVKEYGEAEDRQSERSLGTAAGAPLAGVTTTSPVPGGTTSGPVGGTGYMQTGPGAASTSVGGGLPDEAPGTPGYAIPPTSDGDRGDATAEFAPNVGVGGDQMPSEFGARGTGAQGNRPEEGRL